MSDRSCRVVQCGYRRLCPGPLREAKVERGTGLIPLVAAAVIGMPGEPGGSSGRSHG